MTVDNDNLSRRNDENRVPLAEARAVLRVAETLIEATVMNISNDGLAFWVSDNPNVAVGNSIQVEMAGETFPFNIKWIDEEANRGFIVGGNREL